MKLFVLLICLISSNLVLGSAEDSSLTESSKDSRRKTGSFSEEAVYREALRREMQREEKLRNWNGILSLIRRVPMEANLFIDLVRLAMQNSRTDILRILSEMDTQGILYTELERCLLEEMANFNANGCF